MTRQIRTVADSAKRQAEMAGVVNVLALGIKNDGSEDISAIVNEATARGALFFPAGVYKVSRPLRLQNPVRGEGYSRVPKVNGTRTWFVSDIVSAGGEAGVIEFGGKLHVNVESVNIKCRSEECGIRIADCSGSTGVFISQVGIFDVRAPGLFIAGAGSRPVFAGDMTIFGAKGHPEHSAGIVVRGVCDCRLSNVEVMGTRIGLEIDNGHTYGNNLHLWTGCMEGTDNGTWWKGTRGIVLGQNANFAASEFYPDTCYYAIEQRGNGGFCELANIMCWEDGSIKVSPDRSGEFYHREEGASGRLIIQGGLVGVCGNDADPGWMSKAYAREPSIRDVILKSNYAIAACNIDRLCFGTALPDYTVRYADKGWCKVADVFTIAKTGSCEGILALDDGAAWRITFVKGASGKVEVFVVELNTLCKEHAVKTVEGEGLVKVYVRSETTAPTTARFTTAYMGDYFRPLDHGLLRTRDGAARHREVLS